MRFRQKYAAAGAIPIPYQVDNITKKCIKILKQFKVLLIRNFPPGPESLDR
jgi:hypothetical protein